jgi:hypothetical protein
MGTQQEISFRKWLEDAGHMPGGSADYSNAESEDFKNKVRSKYGPRGAMEKGCAETGECDPRMGFMKKKMKSKMKKK